VLDVCGSRVLSISGNERKRVAGVESRSF